MKAVFEKKDVDIIAKRVKAFDAFPPMFHTHVEVLYVTSGSVTVCIDSIQKEVCEGEVAVIFPYAVHSYEPFGDAEAILVMFSPVASGVFEKKLLSSKPQYPYFFDTEKVILLLLDKVCRHMDSEDKYRRSTAKAYLSAAMGEMLLSFSLTTKQDTDFGIVQQILRFCSDNYQNEDISLALVSENLYVSSSYITKIFSSKLGCSFKEYINGLRIMQAKELLQNTEMKIIDIMCECGFKNQSSFNRIFVETCGMTPKEYRTHRSK